MSYTKTKINYKGVELYCEFDFIAGEDNSEDDSIGDFYKITHRAKNFMPLLENQLDELEQAILEDRYIL